MHYNKGNRCGDLQEDAGVGVGVGVVGGGVRGAHTIPRSQQLTALH